MTETAGASEALTAAAMAALRNVDGLASVQDAGPVQAAPPYALVEAGLETDWGHKNGAGREVRLAVTIRDQGERAERIRRLARLAEGAVAAADAPLPGWRIVSLALLRSRLVRHPDGWIAAIEWRVRLLADG